MFLVALILIFLGGFWIPLDQIFSLTSCEMTKDSGLKCLSINSLRYLTAFLARLFLGPCRALANGITYILSSIISSSGGFSSSISSNPSSSSSNTSLTSSPSDMSSKLNSSISSIFSSISSSANSSSKSSKLISFDFFFCHA